MELGLSLDDVLIVPQYSDIVSRKLIDLKTKFSRNISLNIPIVSANMDTVTESAMAIALAREGGIGVIHRFMPIDKEVEEVKKVKKAETLVVIDPVTISPSSTLKEALSLMRNSGINGLLVVDKKSKLEGILTNRDVRFHDDLTEPVKSAMTPKAQLITAPPDIKREEVIKIFNKYKIEKLPLVDKRGRVRGLITAADFAKMSRHIRAAKDNKGRLLAAAAIGVKDGEERADKLIKAGVDALVIDIAHGHHQAVIKLLKTLKDRYRCVDIVAGNVATPQGAEDLIKAGADAVKVGIGPGKACSTRIVAGAGYPQFSAIRKCVEVTRKYNVPLIADGGIKNSGDLVKAVGAGASSVMIGSLFAGTKESPGDYYIEDGVAYKEYHGMASRAVSKGRAAEGIRTVVNYRGDVAVVMQTLIDGLQSGMSYSGARNIKEFWKKVEFVRVTQAGFNEGKPRP